MLNNQTINYNQTNTVVMPPTCMGTLQKSHRLSKFVRCHKTSNMANWIFSDCPRLVQHTWDKNCKEIVILQIMTFGDEEFLIEYIFKSDWEQ